MEISNSKKINPNIQILIWVVSVIVPALVAFLLFNKMSFMKADIDLSFFPKFHALLNSTVFVLLVSAFVAIKKKKELLHRNIMMGALVLSVVFLVSYVAYHSMGEQVYFGDLNSDGIVSDIEKIKAGVTIGYVYKFVLLSHILLSLLPYALLDYQ